MSQNNIEAIKNTADIVEVVSRVIPLKKQGKDWWAACPFHADKSPSFSVIPAKQIYHCFGCREHGDVISFWMKYNRIPFPEAARQIAAMYGLAFDNRPSPAAQKKQYPSRPRVQGVWQPEDKPEPPALWKEKAGRFVAWANERLIENPGQMRYLAGRGITKETVVAYGLGWCCEKNGRGLYRPRKAWGLDDLLGEDGRPRRLWLPVGLVIPYINTGGEVIKLRIRRPDPLTFAVNMRYYLVSGSSTATTVFNLDRKAHVIVESELDALLIAQEAGDLVGAVALGSVSVRPDARTAARLKGSLHILNALDADRAGAGATPWWGRNFANCVRWPVPRGKDPGEFWQTAEAGGQRSEVGDRGSGGKRIREWVMAGLPEGLR